VLDRLGYKPIDPEPKEGLALNNGTGASTGVAANAMIRALNAVALSLGIHALFAQALLATDQSFDPYIHQMKPHPGQIWTAERMAELLKGSKIIRTETGGERAHRDGDLIQDRYGIRCLPQFLGPIVDGLGVAARQIQTEANTANDNPLIDPETGETFHTGNFLAQYTSVAMDSTRYLLGLMCKHLDSQIALMITPAFSNGLHPALVGNLKTGINVGLKSMHIGCNQMATQISYLGQSVADRFPTHAEMYNQNINSQAMNAANLARDQLDVIEHYLAAALLTGVQAVEIRTFIENGTCDARLVLSPATVPLYEAARRSAKGEPETDRTVVWDDMDGFLQPMVEGILASITTLGEVRAAVEPIASQLVGNVDRGS
jgi:phenylalanine ammonia-lyase